MVAQDRSVSTVIHSYLRRSALLCSRHLQHEWLMFYKQLCGPTFIIN